MLVLVYHTQEIIYMKKYKRLCVMIDTGVHMKTNFNSQAGFGPILLIIIIVAVLAIGIALWWVFTQNNNNQAQEPEEHLATVIEGTMFDAIKQGSALECDWKLNYDGPAALTEGKFYTDGTNGRSESSYKYEDKTYPAIAIINEDRTFHWSPDRGFKTGISDDRARYEAREPKYDQLDTSIDVNFNVDYTFTCHPWTVDESMFTPPEDLKFIFL